MPAPSALHPVPRALRPLSRAVPLLAVAGVFAHLGRGGFRTLAALGWTEAALLVLLLVGIAGSLWRRAARARAGAPELQRDALELGASLVAAAFVVVAIGGQGLLPLVYLLMAFLVAFMPRAAGFGVLAVAVAFDALFTLRPPSPSWPTLVTHACFFALFALLYHAVLGARLAQARRAERDAVSNRIREAEEAARAFRLVSSVSQDRPVAGEEDQRKWLLASVKEIEAAVASVLEIGEVSLKANTCAMFELTSDDRGLKLRDYRSASDWDWMRRETFPAGEGVLGGVLKRGAPVRMHSPAGLKGITYYEGNSPDVRAVVAVPVVERGGHVRGVLVADRLVHEPFEERDEKLLARLAAELLRATEVERVANDMRRSRDETDRFYAALEELNGAGTPEKIFTAVTESAARIAELDLCAVTLADTVDGKTVHKVVRVAGPAAGRALEGLTFEDNNGLVSTVVRYGSPMPSRDIREMERTYIFNEEVKIRGLAALKVFPLKEGGRFHGTLVAGSRKKAAFSHDVLRMLDMLGQQAGQAVHRGKLYAQMERMATTDGLTGLNNHRTFQQKADEELAKAKRHGRKLSLLLTDVDHFKSVNDTYGHPTGDQVLKGVAAIIRRMARDTDVVARYGGEEFALVLPETDAKGALVIAERIREAVRAEVFQTEMGPLKVTLSLGVATFPESSQEKQGLIDLADQCLYHAKRHGRNQSVTVAQMQQGARKLRAVEG